MGLPMVQGKGGYPSVRDTPGSPWVGKGRVGGGLGRSGRATEMCSETESYESLRTSLRLVAFVHTDVTCSSSQSPSGKRHTR